MANRIKELRKLNHLTLLQLADRLGLSESTVQRYESGNIKNLKYETIVSLSNIFKCSPAYLMGWDDGDDAGYYINPETAAIAQMMKESEEMSMLFDAARDADPEDLMAVYDMLLALKRKERRE